MNNQDDLKKLVKERVKAIINEEISKKETDIELAEQIERAKERVENAKTLFIEGDISKAEYNEYRDQLKALEARQVKSRYSMLAEYNVDEIVNKFCENIEKCVEMSLDEDKIDGYLFNSLFDEIIVYPDRIEVNFKLLGNRCLVDIDGCGCCHNRGGRL